MVKNILFVFLVVLSFTGCNHIKNTYRARDLTETAIESLFKEDYETVYSCLTDEVLQATGIDKESRKEKLSMIREVLIEHFGAELTFSVAKSESSWYRTPQTENRLDATVALIEISNKKDLGLIKATLDHTSNKLSGLRIIEMKEPIPSMVFFWLFGLLACCVPIFNIYVIWKIKRSHFKRKWLKYPIVALCNVPAISYAAIGGFTFKLLEFQLLLGISFTYMGYIGSVWSVGLPIGGLYWLYRLRRQKYKEEMEGFMKEEENLAE